MEDKIIEIKNVTDIILSDKNLSCLTSFGCFGFMIMFGFFTAYFGKNAMKLDNLEKEEDI